MTKITFLLLAHQKPRLAQRLIALLLEAGHSVAVHYDKKASDAEYEQLRTAFAGSAQVCFARRVAVGWGHWTICQAALAGIDAIREAGWRPDYVYHISGADYPIRPAAELAGFLDRHAGKSFIEGVPADTVTWVKGGPQRERYLYRHFFSWRERKRLSENAMRFQRALGLERRFVGGMTPYMGSQWWLLPWATLERILEVGRRSEVVRFFRHTLIPDELYFQTLVFNLVPREDIVPHSPTLNQFSDYMVPVMYCADRADYLMRQPFFFARKMSSHRPELSDALDKVWRGEVPVKPFPDTAFGRFTAEYEVTRTAQREGLAGAPVPGKVPNWWSEQLEYIRQPFFGVIGTSVAELRFAQALLSGHRGVVCHGQLYHATTIEFAGSAKQNGGYGSEQLALRGLSAPNFLADMVRVAAPRRMGFLLRFGQGWHIQDVLFDHPYAQVLVLHGDPILGFIESLAEVELRLGETLDPAALRTLPPGLVAARYALFQQAVHAHRLRVREWLAKGKRKGAPLSWSWMVEVDLDVTRPPLVVGRGDAPASPEGGGPRAGDCRAGNLWVEATLSRWRDWAARASACLGIDIDPDGPLWSRFAAELTAQAATRAVLIERFEAAGLDPFAPYVAPPATVEATT